MFATRMIKMIVVLGVLALFAVGCTRPRPREAQLPSGQDLIRAAAQEMQGISSVRFDLQMQGPVGALTIQRANGVLTREGDASGKATVDVGGRQVEYEVVVSGDQVYLKGPTGQFQTVPSSSVYNPAQLLSPSEGLARVLAATSEARTEAAEAVNGTQAYRVRATIDGEALKGVLPVRLKENQVPATLWIGEDRPVLLKAQLTATTEGQNEPTTMTVTLSDFDAPVEITPPPT